MNGFKVSDEGNHHITLSHPDGHEVKIAKAGLSRAAMEKMKALPRLHKYADGGEVEAPEAEVEDADRTPTEEATPSAWDQIKSGATDAFNNSFVGQGVTGLKDLVDGNMDSPAPEVKPDLNQGALDAYLTPRSTQAAPVADPILQSKQDAAAGYEGAAKNLQDAAKLESGAQQAQGQRDAAIAQQQIDDTKKQINAFETAHAELDEEGKQVAKDYLNQHIDPNRVFSQMGTGSKVSTAIGLILSGIGSAASGQENMAMKLLQNHIERDMDAQKQELGKKENMLSYNMKKYGNLDVATRVTAMQYGELSKAMLAKSAATSNSAMAKSNQLKAQGDIEMKLAPLRLETAKFLAGQKLAAQSRGSGAMDNQAASQAIRLNVPEAQQKEYFNDLDSATKANSMKENLLDLFDKAADTNTSMKTGFGYLRTPPEAIAFDNNLAELLRDKDGKVNEGVLKKAGMFKPLPGDLDSTIATKREAFKNWVEEKANPSSLTSLGIMAPKGKPLRRVKVK